MKNKFILPSLIIFFTFCFIIFYNSLENSNSYIPKEDFDTKLPIFNSKDFFSKKEISSQDLFVDNDYYILNIWASWCRDCIVGLPHFKKLQQENPEVVFVNLSLDKSLVKWKQALDRYQIRADHYYLSQGKKGDFGKFINLWWIPRYMVVNETGDIILYKATKITDKKIVEALKN